MVRQQQQSPRRHFHFNKQPIGNYYPLLRDANKRVAHWLTIGPQFSFFVLCFTVVNLLSAVLLYRLNSSQEAKLYFYVYLVIVIYLDISWLACALINPGIAVEENIHAYQTCEECYIRYNMKISVKEGRYHCRRCGICIDEYKYHSYLSGNCIGKNNFIASYFLILGIFLWVIDLAATLPYVYYL